MGRTQNGKFPPWRFSRELKDMRQDGKFPSCPFDPNSGRQEPGWKVSILVFENQIWKAGARMESSHTGSFNPQLEGMCLISEPKNRLGFSGVFF
jgi:hypothetical protein